MVKVKRSDFASFLNTTPAETTATYSRMGKGITEQTVAYNPTIVTEQYIHEDSATSALTAYAPSINTPQTCYAGDPVFDFIDGLRRARAVGSAADTDVVLVYIYKQHGSTAGTYEAEKCACTIAIEDFGGAATDQNKITYTIYLNGNPILGSATITNGTLTFTANT